jgi:hypothetical protein
LAKKSGKKSAKKKPAGGFLDRIKKTVAGDGNGGMNGVVEDDGIDLETGTIKVDDSPPEVVISTAEVLRESTESESDVVRGNEGKVFVIDLGPFFEVMGTDPASKLARSLITFGENLLARIIGRSGTYTLHGDTAFLFRLTVDDVAGWKMASKIVNELGVQFLRDGFKPEEILPEVLAMVDEKDAYDADGNINVEKALEARIPYMEIKIVKDETGAEWFYEEGFDPEKKKVDPEWQHDPNVDPDAEYNPEWDVDAEAIRSATSRVERGQERRKLKLKIQPEKNRRKNNHGRRDSDNPNTSVW